MANAKKGSSGNQKKIEKKDLPLRAKRSDHRGHDSKYNVESEQLDRSEGKRTLHSMPGRKDSFESKGSDRQEGPYNVTTSGGNRPKGRNKSSQGGLDHK